MLNFTKILFLLLAVFLTLTPQVLAQTVSPGVCCSNILFLPGLEASQLSRKDIDIHGTPQNRKAWEPFTNNDVRSLYLDSEGKSINDISVMGIMDTAYGFKNIYKSLSTIMGNLKGTGKIHSWTPFSYDWRMFVPDVVAGETVRTTSGKQVLITEVEQIAATSKTGKVSILAHSNGGLVAKMLVHELEQKGKGHLVDKVVLVGTPQLGTPQAVAALLHGESQELLGGLAMRSYVAREFGANMVSSFGLLPSEEYFRKITDPVVTFKGEAVGSYQAFVDFLIARPPRRPQPETKDVVKPTILYAPHIAKNQWMHELLDTWNFSSSTQAVAIAGWGVPTTASIEYSTSSPRVKKDPNGDGTVISDSAMGVTPNKLYFNIGLYNHEMKKNNTHADIFETSSVKEYITRAFSDPLLPKQSELPKYFSTDKPATKYSWMKWLTVSVHSPVDLDIYDEKGGHMGFIPVSDDPESDIQWFENTIGGQRDIIGDEKYYTVPADGTYSIKLKGTDVGTFTFQVQKFIGEDMQEVANVVYTDLPVTPLLEANTTITASSFASDLNLDVDGDGMTDIRAKPSTEVKENLHIDAYRQLIKSLKLSKDAEKSLLKKLDRIEERIVKGKPLKSLKNLTRISRDIIMGHWKKSRLSETQKKELLRVLEEIIDGLGT